MTLARVTADLTVGPHGGVPERCDFPETVSGAAGSAASGEEGTGAERHRGLAGAVSPDATDGGRSPGCAPTAPSRTSRRQPIRGVEKGARGDGRLRTRSAPGRSASSSGRRTPTPGSGRPALNRRDLLKAFGAAGAAAVTLLGSTAAPPRGRHRPGGAPARQDGGHAQDRPRTIERQPRSAEDGAARRPRDHVADLRLADLPRRDRHRPPRAATEWAFSERQPDRHLQAARGRRPSTTARRSTPRSSRTRSTRHLDPATASPTSYMLGPLGRGRGDRPTDRRLQLHRARSCRCSSASATPTARRSASRRSTQFGDQFGRNPVGTGPYKFVEWIGRRHDRAREEPRAHLGDHLLQDAAAAPDRPGRVHRHPGGRHPPRRAGSGEVDVVAGTDAVPIDKIRSLSETPGVTVFTRDAVGVYYANLNHKIKPLDDLRVRQAINYAVDKDSDRPTRARRQRQTGDERARLRLRRLQPGRRHLPLRPGEGEGADGGGGAGGRLRDDLPEHRLAASTSGRPRSIQENLAAINVTLEIESYPVAEWVPKGRRRRVRHQLHLLHLQRPRHPLPGRCAPAQPSPGRHQTDAELDGWLDTTARRVRQGQAAATCSSRPRPGSTSRRWCPPLGGRLRRRDARERPRTWRSTWSASSTCRSCR